jgi:serine O-acetyltransferase
LITQQKNITIDLPGVVASLRKSREETHKIRHLGSIRELPSRKIIAEIIDELSAVLFPTHFGRPNLSDSDIDFFVGDTLNIVSKKLLDQVRLGQNFTRQTVDLNAQDLADKTESIVSQFLSKLADIRALIVSDVRAAYRGDPAATSISEILLCYPGISAAIHYRLAHVLYELGSYLLAKLISEIAHTKTGVDIHPGARIGEGFFIDHGTGVVIGETAVIGNNVRLYQAVTLGAKSFPTNAQGEVIKGSIRHPVLEDGVVIYAGATVLGRITIGTGSVIGGNVWLTESVPAYSNISQAQSRAH